MKKALLLLFVLMICSTLAYSLDLYYDGKYFIQDGINASDITINGSVATNNTALNWDAYIPYETRTSCFYRTFKPYYGTHSIECRTSYGSEYALHNANSTFEGLFHLRIFVNRTRIQDYARISFIGTNDSSNRFMAEYRDGTSSTNWAYYDQCKGSHFVCDENTIPIIDGWNELILNWTDNGTRQHLYINDELCHIGDCIRGIAKFQYGVDPNAYDVYIDDVYLLNGEAPEAPNQAPTVSIDSPSDGSTEPYYLTAEYTPDDSDSLSLNCTLYLNGILNDTTTGVSLGSTNYFNVTGMEDGTYQYEINCTDGELVGSSGVQTYTMDTINPIITVLSPSNQTTVDLAGQFYLNITGENIALGKLNYSITNSTGDEHFSNQAESAGTTYLSFNDTIDLSSSGLAEGEVLSIMIFLEDLANNSATAYYQVTTNSCTYSCTSFDDCEPDISGGIKDCLAVNETVVCNYTGDYSEYQGSCNYCTKTETTVLGECISDSQTVTYVLTNNETCCGLTGNTDDCTVTNATTQNCGYLQSYGAADAPETILDIIIGVGVFLVGMVTVIGLVLLGSWALSHFRRRSR
jgi:hypothetical protein